MQVDGASIPRTLLSAAAAAQSLDELERAVRAERGYPVQFTDVAPSVDLHRCAAAALRPLWGETAAVSVQSCHL